MSTASKKRVGSQFEHVARRVFDGAAFVFQAHVIGELLTKIVPGDAVPHLRQREREVALRTGDIQNTRARLQHLAKNRERHRSAVLVGVGIPAMRDLAIDLLQVGTSTSPSRTAASQARAADVS